MRIKIKDIYDNVGGYGSGTSIVFEVRDDEGAVLDTVRRESWFTEKGGGVDYYHHEEGGFWTPPEDEAELLEEFMNEVSDEYWTAYRKYVNPGLEAAAAQAIAASEAMADEDKFQGVTVDM